MRDSKEFFGMNLVWFIGVVEDRFDPLMLGRVRVRAFGWHTTDLKILPTTDLPWAQTIQPTTSAGVSGLGDSGCGLMEGSWVFGFFADGSEAQQPMILGTIPGIPSNLPDKTLETGFVDPNKVYPKWANEPDSSRLARHEGVGSTVVPTKESSRTKGVPIANSDQTWDEPIAPYSAGYPFNKVKETESGHVIEIDDTPGCERLHWYHRAGSFEEIDANGSRVVRTVGDEFHVCARSKSVVVKGDWNVTVAGNCNIKVGNNASIEVDGDVDVVSHNNANIKVASAASIVASSFAVKATDGYFDFGTLNINTSKYNLTVADQTNIRWEGDKFEFVGANTYHRHDEGTDHSCPIDPPRWSNTYCEDIVVAPDSGLGGPPNMVTIQRVSVSPLELITRGESVAVSGDDAVIDADKNSPAYQQRVQRLENDKITSAQDYEKPPSSPAPTPDPLATPKKSPPKDETNPYVGANSFPDSTKLSEHFTLGQLSTRAAASHYRVNPQHGLSTQDIVNNLRLLAENVLEPLYAKYGSSMIVTSGFRTGNSKSKHERGQAVDIQFSGLANRTDYTARAKEIQSLIPYDQLLLEHKSYGTGRSWIHISFVNGANRSQVLTLYNDRTYSNGLVTV